MIHGYCCLVEIRFGNNPEVVLLEFFGDPQEIWVALVESVTIPDDLVDVGVELSWGGIQTIFQVIFYFGQVHRLLDDFKVLRDS